jgi:hypothetical protein
MLTRAAIYEQLFGRNSDWVAGARLLAQSYEEEAREHERMASKHVSVDRHSGIDVPFGLPGRASSRRTNE